MSATATAPAPVPTTTLRSIPHWIAGTPTAGTSGRSSDVFHPATGTVQAQVPLASEQGSQHRRSRSHRSLPRLVRTAAPPPRPRSLPLPRDLRTPPRRSRHHHQPRARQSLLRRQGRSHPRPRSRRVCHRNPTAFEGRIHRAGRHRCRLWSMRQPLGVVAGITPFNFPAMVPMWMFPGRYRLWQHLHPQAQRARSLRRHPHRRDAQGSRPPRRRLQRHPRRQARRRHHPPSPRHRRRQLRRLHPHRRVRLPPPAPPPASASRPSAEPRTTSSSCPTPTSTRPPTPS